MRYYSTPARATHKKQTAMLLTEKQCMFKSQYSFATQKGLEGVVRRRRRLPSGLN